MATGIGRTLSIFLGSVCLKKLLLEVFHAFCAQFPFKRGCGADSTLEKNHMAIHIFCLLVGFGFLAASKFRLDKPSPSELYLQCSSLIGRYCFTFALSLKGFLERDWISFIGFSL
jgi:hypothetical protein